MRGRMTTATPGPQRVARLLAVTALAVGVAGCGQDPELVSAPITYPPSAAPVQVMDRVLSVDFDEASGPLVDGAPVADTSGRHMTGTATLGGGSPEPLSAVPGRQGQALRFARLCDSKVDPSCPKGIVEFPAAALLNPGARDFRFGASLLLSPEETSDGSNVMQKGFNTGGKSQWKLQVDGDAGRPSCVVVGMGEGQDVVVTAKTGVADGQWHDVECLRADGQLTVLVDGVESNRKPIPAETVVEPPSAVRIGGKNVAPDNDQFFGVIDDVFLEIARS